MPTYEYHCDECGADFELFQSIKARPIRKCPTCGKRRVRRLIGTGAGIIFKGNGFYATDYRSDSYRQAAKEDKPAGEAEKKKGEKKEAEGKGQAEAEKPSDKNQAAE